MKKQGADVIGAKAGAKPKKPYIQKDTIGSTQNAEIVYGIGDGENGGLINGLNSIILDGTRVIGSSGEVNFNEVKYEERFGLIDQPPLKLIEDTITERGLNLEVRSAAPVVSSFNNKDVDKFVVRISVPSLMQNKDNGDSVAATISYAIDISVDGGAYQTVLEASATEKITNGYEFDHEIDAPVGTQRTIRVRRTTPDSTSQLLIDKFYVAAISEVINAKFSHPTLHYIGLVFNAEQFNNIPKAVFHYYGRKIKVPVNYNPTTRQYDGIWNGTFKVVYSNNPAWVLFDILTDRRSGLGRRIPVELVDKWELYRIAQYCDELVPDGEGGMEPRFVCNNLVLNSKQDAYQVLKDIASIFRGQSFWNGSQVVTVADAPRDIDYAISMASVISYSYSGTARNARHNVVKVQYYDKNNENSAAYEYATDYDSIRETEQINEVEIRAFGCTSAGQAQRLARYTLLSEQTETRILTAKLSMDAFVNMQIGDVFAWSDKFLAGANNGGRVVAVNGAELTLDRDVTDSALVGDTLFVNTTSGKANTRTITAINGNKVTLDAVMSTTEPEFVWVIDSAELSLLYFKLDDYKVNPAEGTVDIVGIQHVNGKFGTIDTETALEAPPFSKVEIETLRAPGNVITSFNVRVDQGINLADLYVSWGQVKGATRYTVEFRRDSQAWRVLGNVTGLTHTIENVSAGIYEVRVRAADSIGNLSPYGFSAPINVAGIVLPPPKLTSFTAVGKLLAIATKWTFPAGTEASLAVVIEHATQDPANVGVPTQKINIPYPQTEYVFNGLGAHSQMWFRAAIVDKYNQEGEFTAWTTATADANPEELIDLISGYISEGTLDQTLKGKIDGAGALAGEAQDLANQAKTAAANAQTTANNAGTAAANAQTAATAAANAAAKEVTDRVAAVTAETNARTAALTKEATDRATAIAAEAKARTDGLTKEATDRATALTTQANTLKADSAAKVKALKDEVDPKITTLQNGITQVTTDYKAGDTAVVGQINAYKASNDSAVASVLQKAESAVSTGSTNSSAITAINGQISTINGALSTKLDASVISGYYTKGQTDAKAAEIAAGKVEEFKASIRDILTYEFIGNGAVDSLAGWEISGGSSAHDFDENEGHLAPGSLKYASSSAGFRVASSYSVKLEKGRTYTISFWYKTNATYQKMVTMSVGLVERIGSTYYIPGTSITAWDAASEEWRNVTRTFTVDTTVTAYFRIGASGHTDGSDSKLWVDDVSVALEGTESLSAKISANSQAISTIDAEVARVDGRVTATNSNVTTLSGRVSSVEGVVSTKAEAAALTALTTRVSNAEGVNTSQGSAITTLENSVNHATTGLASKASSTALTAVDNKVTAANGRIDTTNSNVATLTGRVSTVEGAVSTKAEAAALTALTTRVGNAEGVNTSQGTAITTLQNTVNHATTGLATKASTSALTATNSEVSRVNGVVTGHAGQLTQLAADITTINGTLATKANASALNDIYTKTQADAKATEIAAGEVSKYDASLVIGGVNLINRHDELPDKMIDQSGAIVPYAGISAINGYITVKAGEPIILSKVDAGDANYFRYAFYDDADNVILRQASLDNLIRLTTPANATRFRVSYPTAASVQAERGTKATAIAPSSADVQSQLDTNATAITNTNAEVARVDGRVTTESGRITTLTGRVSTVENGLALKADASALSSLTTRVETEEGKSTSQGSAITALQNTVNHATTGLSTKASSAALTVVDNKVTAANGRIDTTNSNVTTLSGRVATVEGDISKKADASALTSLTTRVEAEEGKSTSQGTAITALQNSVNHATTGLATKASSAALTTVDNKVIAVDGRVTTTNSNVATLTGRVSTVEGSLATKADVSALNNIYTKSETDAKATSLAAGEISKYDASLVIGGTNLLRNSNFANDLTGWEAGGSASTATVLDDTIGTFKKVAKVVSTTSSAGIKVINAVARSELNLSFGEEYTFSGWLRADAAMTVYVAIDGSGTTNATAVPVGVEWVKFTHTKKASDNRIPRLYGSGTFYVANLKIERGNKATDWSEADSTIVESLNANATAIATTNTEVSRINGVVSGHTTQLSNLTASIAGKADTSALNALTVRVAAEEGKSSSQASDLVSLSSSLGKSNLVNKDAWRLAGNLGYILPTGAISVLSNHVYSDFIPVSTNQLSWALTDIGSGGSTSMRIAFYKDDKTFHSIPVNGGVEAVSSGVINVPAAAAYVRISVPLVHTVEAVFKSSAVDLSGYATAAALNSLTTRVATEEGKSTSQGTAITNLENAVNHSTTGLASKASSSALTTLNNQVQHSTTGLSAVNTKVDSLKATVENTTNGLASKASSSALDTLSNKVNHSTTGLDAIASKTTVLESDVAKALDVVTISDTRSTNQPPSWYWANYARRTVNEFKTQTVIGVGGFFGGTYCNLETNIPYGDSSGGHIVQTATSSADPSLYVQRVSTSTTAWGAWAQPIKDLRDGLAGKAAASAVESLTTRVGTAEGRINTEAGKLTTLSTTVGDHTTTINSQTTSINGIRGVHALKFDTNGVISGYGLISELVNGTVKSQFGVNADNFFIGAPSSNKKPFIVYTSPGLINGVTVPAGTYIDTAFIGDATIDTAHIRDLNVTTAKIGNGAITTAKIGDLQVDTLKIKDNAVTVPIGVRYSNVIIDSDAVRAAMNVYAEAQGWRRADGSWDFPTTLQGSITVWEAGTPDLFNITIPRAGGKCRIDLSLSTSLETTNGVRTFVAVSPGNQPENVLLDTRMFISLYRSGTLIGRTSMAPTSMQGTTVGFVGNLALMTLDDTAMTGNVVYKAKISFGYVGNIANTIKITPYFGKLILEQMTVSALEIKK